MPVYWDELARYGWTDGLKWRRQSFDALGVTFLPYPGATMTLLRILLCLLLPPLAVFLTVGIKLHFWLNIVLTLLGGVPGMVHALWVVAKNSD